MEHARVTAADVAAAEGLADWRVIVGTIQAHFRAGSFPAAAALVSAVAEVAEAAGHHPDVEVRYPDHVRVVLTTHATGGLTAADVAVARQVSAVASRLGAAAVAVGDDTARTGRQVVEVAIDTMDEDRIRPFWAAVLGYRVDARGQLVDPLRHGPTFWFQQMDEPRPHRDRFHIDVVVPHDEAEARIAAALAAGGRMVTDRYARMWWVLADADGNEACVCTWQDRG